MKSIIVLMDSINEKGIKILENDYIVKPFSKIDKEDYDKVVGLIVRLTKINDDTFNMFPNLKVVGKHGIGVDNIRIDLASKRGIKVFNTPESNVVSVAEHVISLMMALSKSLFKLNGAMQNHQIKQGRGLHSQVAELGIVCNDINGKKIGIIGFGKIGKTVARFSLALGMKVCFYDPYITELKEQFNGEVEQYGDYGKLVSDCDVVTMHLPLTETTKNMLNYEIISKMKPTAYLISCARGGVVNEEDLAKCISEKKIAGAGVDVFDTEPPAPDNPLFGLENVILTPHMAGGTKEAFERMAVTVAQEIISVLKTGTSRYFLN